VVEEEEGFWIGQKRIIEDLIRKFEKKRNRDRRKRLVF
jgi:hypothetical protein